MPFIKYWRNWKCLRPAVILATKFQEFSSNIIVSGNKSSLKVMCTNGVKDSACSPRRFYAVHGFEDRHNDVVYGPPLVSTNDASVVVFFPGDVQDYTENMEAHRDNKHHKQWNLESTADKLQRKFHDCHILVIKPSRMGFKTFSCFRNFVESNELGVPEHTANRNALRHLDYLVRNVSDRLKSDLLESDGNERDDAPNVADDSEDSKYVENLIPENSRLKLIGFSKGCVVLNQLLHEFHHNGAEKDPEIMSIILRIKDMYWLDGGHSGGEQTWITDKNILSSLSSLDINIHVHVTPYQIKDDRRPWIKKEEKAFSEYLTKHGCKIDRTVHFESVPPGIATHFDVINAFKK